MTHAQELLERWNFGPGEPPLPGRVAARLGEVAQCLRTALDAKDLSAVERACADLESLRAALELWTSVELDAAALHAEARHD